MGDRLGIHSAVDILTTGEILFPTHTKQAPYVIFSFERLPPATINQPAVFSYLPQLFFNILPSVLVYGHITLNTPVLVRSLKLSKVEPC